MRISIAAVVTSAATTIARRGRVESARPAARSMAIALATNAKVKTHSAMTVDVARNTNAGVMVVNTATVAAFPRSTARQAAR